MIRKFIAPGSLSVLAAAILLLPQPALAQTAGPLLTSSKAKSARQATAPFGTTCPTGTATVGQAYSSQLSGFNGSGSYSWSLAGGSLSPLSLSSSGLVSGTPTASGTLSFTVRINDNRTENFATQGCSIVVSGGPVVLAGPLLTTSVPDPNNCPGSAPPSVASARTTDPVITVWYALGGLGAQDHLFTQFSLNGIVQNLDSNYSGFTSGGNYAFCSSLLPTASSAGTWTLSTYVDGQSLFNFPFPVFPGFSINTSAPLPPGMVGVNYSYVLTSSNGTAPYTYVLSTATTTPNNLPPGLSLSTNGTISGSPTASGAYAFNVTATDATGTRASSQILINITPALVITTASPLPSATVGVSYSQTFAASGGTSPYGFAITGSAPAGLTMSKAGVLSGTPTVVGPVSFTVQVTDNLSFSVTKQFQFTVASASALLQVSQAQLSFSAVIGGDAPASQTLAILSTNGALVNFAAKVIAGANGVVPTWVAVSPSTGATPGSVAVAVNQGSMTASPAPATIQITVPGNTGQSPILVTVSLLLVTANPQLQVTPPLLRFGARVQAPATLEQAIAVSSTTGSISFSTSIQSQSSWITGVTPSSGQTSPNAPVILKVGINTQGLGLGSHHDVIVVNSSAGSVNVPVSVFVSDQGAIISVDVTGLRFLARQGLGSSVPRTVSVLNTGDPATKVNWTAKLISGADWLTLGSAAGTATLAVPGNLVLSPAASSSSFAVGGRYGLVEIADPAALNSPQYVSAVLDVEAASSPPVPELLPAGMFFVTTGTGVPAPQSVLVYASSTPVAFQVGTTTTDGNNWLTATINTASASETTPGTITISASPAGLGNGIFTGSVNVSIGSVLRTLTVTLVVTPVLPSAIQSGPSAIQSGMNPLPQPLAVTACIPGRLAITQTTLENNFAVPAGWPATLVVQLHDDCGRTVTNGSAVASFSNGDPPLSLSGDGQTGTYSATWQPGIVVPQMTVNVSATAPSFPTATAQFTGTVNANSATVPTLVPNGALHIFFSGATAAALGGGLAPGNVAQVYGAGLAATATSTGSVPLVTQFNGTFMVIGGYQAPLYYVNPGQLDVQIPSELVPNRQYQMIVSANGALTLPQTIDLVPLQPGTAFNPDGSVIAQHGDATLVTSASPAKAGEAVVIYLAGMGATNPAVPSGAPTPVQLVPVNVQPIVTLDGQQVAILYAGLTPTGVGLYQINFTVPSNAKTGSLKLVITQNGVAANTTTLPVVSAP